MARIKSSLSAKVFIILALLLTLCCLVIYGVIMLTLPRSYSIVATDRVSSEIDGLVNTLSNTSITEADEVLDDFCTKNRASIILSIGTFSRVYGALDASASDYMTSGVSVNFSDVRGAAFLNITAPVSAGRELNMAFLELLPWLLCLIILISAAGAFICSRALVRPVLELSNISNRMANLDMTWEFRSERTDELGQLARSLDTLSRRLDSALKTLEDANRQLRADMEHITALSAQRRDFFAAASHELKTPLTILRGQVESMLMGIGKYKDVQASLPETLREVENMERLVGEILSVSKLEMEGMQGCNEAVSMRDILSESVEALRPLAEEKEINISAIFNSEPVVAGSPVLIERAMHNIVGNAVRHSPNGSDVTIELDNSLLTVMNTGVTIPDDDLPDMFTPFHRIDKSRNRSTGGSGLGLYIVKTIFDLHGFKYKIENKDDAVLFTVEFGA